MKVLARFCVLLTMVLAGGVGASSYVNLTPEFVVNYGDAGRVRYLKAEITLRVRDDAAVVEINHHADAIRHELVLLLSRQTNTTLGSSEGKEALRNQALKAIQDIMLAETGQVMVDQVLFTNFFIQR